MKRTSLALLFVLMLFTLVFAAGDTFTHPTHKFSITKPSDAQFEFEPNPQGRSCRIVKKYTRESPWFFSLSVGVDNQKTPQEIAATLNESIEKSFKDIKKKKQKTSSVAGCKAIDLMYWGMHESGEILYTRWYIFEAKNGLVYLIDLQCTKDKEEEYEKEIKKIIKSFKYTK
jgi:hypothetical protein